MTRAAARSILESLAAAYPDADTELAYGNSFQLLVATILSAQTTDRRVNEVTPTLFRAFPDAAALAAAPAAEVERLIQPTGFFRQKARTLLRMSEAIVAHHGGQVPASMDELVALAGVGRKTANVVLGHAFGIPGFAVDRHVLRVANRLGIASSNDPDEVERQVTAVVPAEAWTRMSDVLILHGRRVCRPTPSCDRCVVARSCAAYARGAAGTRTSRQATGRSRSVARRPAGAPRMRAGVRRRGGGRAR